MERCAFVIHPHSFEWLQGYLRSRQPSYRPRRKALMLKVLEWTPVHRMGDAVRIGSLRDAAVEVVLINTSLLPEQWVTLPEDFVVRRVTEAARLGAELGARVIGLSAFTSIVGDQGAAVARALDVAVTSGNTFTVHSVLADVRRAAAAVGLDLRHASVTILGATGDIGSACARILASEVRHLTLCARTRDTLDAIAGELRAAGRVEISTAQRARDAVLGADVVISATSALASVIDPDSLGSGVIVCDVGFPRHISAQLLARRPDLLAFESGLVCPPQPAAFDFDTGFPAGTIAACLAETALLTLERRFESYSLGRGRITAERVGEIGAMAERHGFRLDRLRCGAAVYDDAALARVRAARETPRRRHAAAAGKESA